MTTTVSTLVRWLRWRRQDTVCQCKFSVVAFHSRRRWSFLRSICIINSTMHTLYNYKIPTTQWRQVEIALYIYFTAGRYCTECSSGIFSVSVFLCPVPMALSRAIAIDEKSAFTCRCTNIEKHAYAKWLHFLGRTQMPTSTMRLWILYVAIG